MLMKMWVDADEAGNSETDESAGHVLLTSLSQGDCAVVVAMDIAEADQKRLQVMGVCPGRDVWVVKKGDPWIVRVMGTRIGISESIASSVYVVPNGRARKNSSLE